MATTGIPRGNVKGLNVFGITLSPASVAPNVSAEQTFAFNDLTTQQTVIVQKPTAQAGLVIGGSRVSAANTLAITFANLTAATITPTAGEIYQLVRLSPEYFPLPQAS